MLQWIVIVSSTGAVLCWAICEASQGYLGYAIGADGKLQEKYHNIQSKHMCL
jgi:hypothetical protein